MELCLEGINGEGTIAMEEGEVKVKEVERRFKREGKDTA